jgi:hypothetical protein
MATIEVRRDDFAQARVVDEEPAVLADGQALLAVERFGITANVITYAVAGDAIGYWRFFPASEEGWGRIPVWGFAEVVASASEALDEGERLFGYLPMASHVCLTPEQRGGAVVDTAEHRAELPPVYNRYRRVGGAPSEGDARELVLRPLLMTSFLLADQLVAEELSGARQVLVSSASSKTALGLAFELARAGVRVVGLTSARNADFVRSVGIYDEIVTYDGLGAIDGAVDTVAVDVAGAPDVRRRVHEAFGDHLQRSVLVGATHRAPDAFRTAPGTPGPRPEFFFAPDRVQVRAREWGRAEFQSRVEAAFAACLSWTEGWLRIETSAGRDAALAAYRRVLAGEVAPDTALVASL